MKSLTIYRRGWDQMTCVILICCFSISTTWAKEFTDLVEEARTLSLSEYQENEVAMPDWLVNLNYDQYRMINYKREYAYWKEDSKFAIELMHPGYLYKGGVQVNIDGNAIDFDSKTFDYRKLDIVKEWGDRIGFGGIRILYRKNLESEFREISHFQGASYWRAVGHGQWWGLSSRGLSINTGDPEPEEFPVFKKFWLEKPQEGSDAMALCALLDSPSITGAYKFKITPGETTVMEVQSEVFARKDIRRLGVAPMSSMYWYSLRDEQPANDHRPAVHDSEGLSVLSKGGEAIWRPLMNPAISQKSGVNLSWLQSNAIDGFGLIQRNQNIKDFKDLEANYHLRPSLWIEPINDWGEGDTVLVEIPTDSEYVDNMVAMWEPRGGMKKGASRKFDYYQKWTRNRNPGGCDYILSQSNISKTDSGVLLKAKFSPTSSSKLMKERKISVSISPVLVSGKVMDSNVYPIEGEVFVSDGGEVSAEFELKEEDLNLIKEYILRLTINQNTFTEVVITHIQP